MLDFERTSCCMTGHSSAPSNLRPLMNNGGGGVHAHRVCLGDVLRHFLVGDLAIHAAAQLDRVDAGGPGPGHHLRIQRFGRDAFLILVDPIVELPEGLLDPACRRSALQSEAARAQGWIDSSGKSLKYTCTLSGKVWTRFLRITSASTLHTGHSKSP